MRILFFTLTLLFLFSTMVEAAADQDTRMLFVVQLDNREKATLKEDAELIGKAIQQLAKPGDLLEGITLSGEAIFSLNLNEDENQLQAKRKRNIAINDLVQFFQPLLSPESQRKVEHPDEIGAEKIDVAAVVNLALERFNAEETRHRYVLVLFTHGLQKDKSVDFSGGYPSDSWISHPTSPFSAIPPNETGSTIEVILIHQPNDYVNTFHAKKIERWYSLLLHRKKAKLIGFTPDHKTAFEFLKRGSRTKSNIPQPEEIDGPLILYRVSVGKQNGSVPPVSPEPFDFQERTANRNSERRFLSAADRNQASELSQSSQALSLRIETSTQTLAHKTSTDTLSALQPFARRVEVVGSSPVHVRQQAKPCVTEIRHKALPSVNVETPPKILTGSVFKLTVSNGTASLWVSVRDPRGNPQKNLRAANFQVSERIQGKSRQIPASEITLQSEAERKSLAMVLLKDVSGSIDETGLRHATDALQTSIDQMKSGDMAALLHFSATVSVVQPFCTDVSALKSAAWRPPAHLYRGGTALWDALFFALDLLERQENRFLKAVIGFTDGIDGDSKTSPQAVIGAARQASIPLFLIGVGSVDEANLRSVAENSGGLYFSASETQALSKIYQTLSGVLNYTYLISYPTQATTNTEVEVEVTAKYTQGKERFQGQFSWRQDNQE